MAKSEGKKFEEDFEASLKTENCLDNQEIHFQRLKDDMGKFKGVRNPYDYMIFRQPKLYLLELKSVKTDTIPFSNFAEKRKDKETGRVIQTYERLKKLAHAGEIKGVEAGFLIEFRKTGVVYYATASQVYALVANGERKSITRQYADQHFIMVRRWLARTRHRYHVGLLMRRIDNASRTDEQEQAKNSNSAAAIG